MNKAIIGRKVGMTQIFTPEGKVIPVTVVEAGPCPVVQIKTVEKDGYAALKLGFDETTEKRLSKPELGQFKKAGVKPQKVLKEFRLADLSSYEVGKDVTVEQFKEGERVDVVGTSKGHGFTGVIKRWNQHRLKETHGVGPVHREVGSFGSINPARVFKQMHMPGQYGLSLIHISEPTRRSYISFAVFCLKKFFFNDTATTEIYTRLFVGSVRCV